MAASNERIATLVLDDQGVVRYAPDIERERAVAIYDLLADNRFRAWAAAGAPAPQGPYDLVLAVRDDRLHFLIGDATGRALAPLVLPLAPLRRLVRDYFTVCDSYYDAIRTATPSQIEAIDMGRRALHDEGATRLIARLADRVEIDHPTARRLFTLVCVLHIRN